MCGSTIFALPEGRYCMAFTDPNSVIEQAARILLPEQNFFISISIYCLCCIFSSVAGDRGRASNYVYGSAKAMVTAFTSGLRQRLHKSNVAVVTIKPGFVDTPMTAGFKKGLLWVKPESVAKKISRAIDHREGEDYAPTFWWLIMLVIKFIPENLFKKLDLF